MARSIVRFNPIAELDALQKQFFGDDFLTRFSGANLPTTDVYTENDTQITVEAHLPNFDEDDIGVSIDEGALVIQAQKHEREEDKTKKYIVRESSSSFYRRITLPDRADQDKIDAQFENGVLKVVVPFSDLPTPKKIAINRSNSANDSQTQIGKGASSSKQSK